MIILELAILVWMAAGCLYWLAVLYLTIRIIRSIPFLEDLADLENEEWPQVSVIVTVWNEAENVRGPVTERLKDTYDHWELILVDDRSSDDTPWLVDELAASDRRVVAVHTGDIPGGWLSKIYAMQRGVEEASGQWLVFSDADARVSPGTIARAVSYCESRDIEHLAVIPGLQRSKALMDSVSQVLLRIMLLAERVWATGRQGSNAAVGSPSFTMVRRSALDGAGGLAEIRMEPSEDVALAQMIKAAGGRSAAVNGRGYVDTYFYRTIREAKVDMERSVYSSLGNFSLARVLALALLFFALEFGPYLFFLPLGIPYHDLYGTVAVSLGIIVSILICRWMRLPLAAAFFFPIDLLIVTYVIVRAGVVCAAQGGFRWRGDFYSSEMLRMGRRFGLR